MSRKCCIPICPNAKTGADEGICYHPFPADAEQRAKWVEFIGADPAKFRWRSKYICSSHFLLSEVITTNAKSVLLNDAVPMIYAPEDLKDEQSDMSETETTMVSADAPNVNYRTRAAPMEDPGAELRMHFCRICIKKKQGLVPLDSRLHNIPLPDVIHKIFGLKIVSDEQLSTMICGSCIEKIDVSYNVYTEFHNYARILKKMVENAQISDYYACYDQHRFQNSMSCNEDYLNSLLESLKQGQEIIIPKIEPDSVPDESLHGTIVPDVPETAFIYAEDETMAVEGTYLDEDFDGEVISEEILEPVLPLAGSSKPKRRKRKPEPEIKVFSWKDLYKPKPKPKPKPTIKIEKQPAPKLVPNTCYTCDPHSSFENAEALKQHLAIHVDQLPYTCATCHCDEFPAVFRSLVSVNRHLMSHLFIYKCDHCWHKSQTYEGGVSHMKLTHEADKEDGSTCETCGAYFKNVKALKLHVQKHRALEDERYKCSHCGKLFALAKLLERHERTHTGEKPYECKHCGKRFNHNYNLQIHVRRHTGERTHACDECGKTFFDSTQLRAHLATHFPGETRPAAPSSKKRHVVSVNLSNTAHTGPTPPREYFCDFEDCDFVTGNYQLMYNHKNRHTRPFRCDVCGRTFTTSQSAKLHKQAVHDGIRREGDLPCPYCSKLFYCKSKLQEHVNSHENNRPFQCQFCEKSFVQKINCTAHERIHTGERPHQCRGCSESFISSSARTKHETKCHPELPQIDLGQPTHHQVTFDDSNNA